MTKQLGYFLDTGGQLPELRIRKITSLILAIDWLHTSISYIYECPHRKKEFPVPSRDVTTKLGNNDVITELFLPMGSLVSDIPAGEGKLVNLFLRCSGREKETKVP
jgi:hypothetical protein